MAFVVFWVALMGVLAAGGTGVSVFYALAEHGTGVQLASGVLAGLAATTPFLVAGAIVALLIDIRDSLAGDEAL